MDLRWTTLGLGFGLLGVMALGTNCIGQTQTQQIGAASEKGTDGSGAPKPKAKDDEALAMPPSDWLNRDNRVGLPLLKNIAEDQKALWIGPKSVRFADADWLVPLGGVAAGMFVTDSSYSRHLSNSPNRIKYSKDLSNYGLASMAGIGGGLWVLGHMTHDDLKIETGVLAGEAAIDTLVPVYAMKYAFGRERPLTDNYRGRFGQGGDSFPSQHAAAAWSIASVIAHEYPGPLTSLFAYGLASAVSASRITGKQHFPSDVLVGSAIGWLEGMYVYRKHHDARIGGGDWETYVEAHESGVHSTSNMGSPYVPLDSWIYPALERLIGQGYINDAILGMRPWTRIECARLVDQVEDHASEDATGETQKQLDMLRQEFYYETETGEAGGSNRHIQVESVYTRFTGIAGKPFFAGTHYDFGQTIINDFGRPYEEGLNNISGFSGWATTGRWVGYVRGEYQSAPSGPPLPDSATITIKHGAHLPEITPFPSNPTPSTSRVRLLDAYVGLEVDSWQVSFGKQTLWWGPGLGGSMLFTNNIEPINMFRINRVSPLKLPSVFGWLGPLRVEFFVGQLEGHEIVSGPAGPVGQFGTALHQQPFIHGQKLSFRPTKDFELSFSRTTIFAGAIVPFTAHEFWFSLTGTSYGPNAAPGGNLDPGDRRSALDFTYRVPKLRNWLTVYADGFTDDQFSPVAYWDRSAWTAGVYIPALPKLHKFDFRAEGIYTDLPIGGNVGRGFFYSNIAYPNGYTNYGNLIGSWIGRQGQGAQAWTTYSFGSKSSLQWNYRHEKISQQFIPGGGTITDASMRGNLWLRQSLSITGFVQHETWNMPDLAPRAQTNWTGSLGLSFWPRGWSK